MVFYVLCTESFVTGGTELAHQLCSELVNCGCEAYMYYVKSDITEPRDVPAPEKFMKYNTHHATDFREVDKKENCIIVPESLTDWVFLFNNALVGVWWMSVDNFGHIGDKEYFSHLGNKCRFHLVQSEYASNYLRKQEVMEENIIWLSDYIGEIYTKFILPPQYRKNLVVFNPKKGFEDLQPLIKMCDFVEWKPLINMSEEEMVLNMQVAKLYIDFGKHPGKDRIPREAASCGCCIITNKKGSAAFYEDIPIDDEYKFMDPIDYNAVAEEMKKIIYDYENHFHKYDNYRAMISGEKDRFSEDTKKFVELISRKYFK